MLDVAANICRNDKNDRITPRHIRLAVKKDEELDRLLGPGVDIAWGGTVPNNILDDLVKNKKRYSTGGVRFNNLENICSNLRKRVRNSI